MSKGKKHQIPHVYWVGRNLATENLVPGESVYGERLINNLRLWDPRRSKLCSALLKNMKVPLKEDFLVLYLGVASGTTASHMSDIVRNGFIFGVDFAPRSMRDFYFLCKKRKNMAPIPGNANIPEEYAFVPKVDFIYQDVAQPNQADILIRNARFFLKSKGHALFMVKARSIDVTLKPQQVYKSVIKKLTDEGFKVIDKRNLAPFEKDHLAILLKF
jgi:fibrillarin-like pre-rRNA processing protein